MATLASILADREEVTCPICGRPLVVTEQPDGKSRFDGCGRNCVPVYWVPEDSIIFGPKDCPMTVFRKKWNPNEPAPTIVPKYTNGGW
jgi:hypothetical protein